MIFRSKIAKLGFLVFLPQIIFATLQPYQVDPDIHHQAAIFDRAAADSYYCKRIPIETFLDFLDVYQRRPIQENQLGMRSQGIFFLWYLLKEINPSLVIESGIYRGQSTWIMEQAVPSAKVIAIDPDLNPRLYISNKVSYTTRDFSLLTVEDSLKESTVCFFDDHQNAFDRVMQTYKKGIKHLIFDDNYRPGYNEFGPSQLTLRECFELPAHTEKAQALNKIIKRYLIMPQIVGNSAYNSCDGTFIIAKAPALWPSLDHIDGSLRERMKVFYDDSIYYRWITYVELY